MWFDWALRSSFCDSHSVSVGSDCVWPIFFWVCVCWRNWMNGVSQAKLYEFLANLTVISLWARLFMILNFVLGYAIVSIVRCRPCQTSIHAAGASYTSYSHETGLGRICKLMGHGLCEWMDALFLTLDKDEAIPPWPFILGAFATDGLLSRGAFLLLPCSQLCNASTATALAFTEPVIRIGKTVANRR